MACLFIKHRQKEFKDSNGKQIQINSFIMSGAQYVVYTLRCPCGLRYVGRTIRTMRTRFGEHRRFIEKVVTKHSVPRYFSTHHNESTSCLELFGIEAISMQLPEGEKFSQICKRETFWIFNLNSMSPGGLNEELEDITII